MKKVVIIIFLISSTPVLFSQALFTYGNNNVSKEEFLRAYNKNKTVVPDKEKAMREYLDLYIKFKLKVKAAQDMQLDTLAALKSDLQNFRGQIEESYMNDQNELNALVDEAFLRSQKDIRVAHLFIPAGKSTNPADTLKWFKAVQAAYKDISKENESFGIIASELLTQNIPAQSDNLGFITVFSLPYEYENIVYNLKPGQVSKPYRTKSGYHIFRNNEERKAVGKLKAAQIMFALQPDAPVAEQQRIARVADSVYRELKNGADFTEMAKNMSNDKMTYMSGGLIPEFGTGKFDPAYEEKAFSLKKNGDITPPFRSEFGYHIIKRLDRTPVPSTKSDANYMYALKQQVQQDTRISIAKAKFLKQVFARTGYKKNNVVNDKALMELTDSFVLSNKKITIGNLSENTILHSFNNSTVKVGNWLQFVREYKSNANLYKGESNEELLQKYIALTANELYRKQLQNFDPEFKYQLEEFKDGNMLFEIMERNVWTKAAADTIGLQNYYDLHKSKYTWHPSADAILFSGANETAAKEAANEVVKGVEWRKVMENGAGQIQTDSGRYELTQIPVSTTVKLSEGTVTEPVVNAADGTASFVKVLHLYTGNQQRNFEEARGLVINDYQGYVEEKWITDLRRQYPVKINEAVFKSISH